MSKHLFAKPPALPTYVVITGILTLIRVFLVNFPGDRLASDLRAPKVSTTHAVTEPDVARPSKQLNGAAARKCLNETVEGQSLMQAVTAARFGLKPQDRGPLGEVFPRRQSLV